jgi:hypothetical protein
MYQILSYTALSESQFQQAIWNKSSKNTSIWAFGNKLKHSYGIKLHKSGMNRPILYASYQKYALLTCKVWKGTEITVIMACSCKLLWVQAVQQQNWQNAGAFEINWFFSHFSIFSLTFRVTRPPKVLWP